ncbi:hypothetical protein DPSP01_010535 [Paraphaeosphaeria sporulosa]
MEIRFRNAYIGPEVPNDMVKKAKHDGDFRIYFSGGGFRGWGYLRMYQNQTEKHHYPISIIDGFTVTNSEFSDTERLKKVAHTAQKIFRISDRRRGVREGVLFQALPLSIHKQNLLTMGTTLYAKASAPKIVEPLLNAIPEYSGAYSDLFSNLLSVDIVEALLNTLYVHSTMSKGSSCTSALYSTSTGLLSSTHGDTVTMTMIVTVTVTVTVTATVTVCPTLAARYLHWFSRKATGRSFRHERQGSKQ